MKIKVKYEVSETSKHDSFNPEDLGFTEKEWKKLPYDKKVEALMDAVENDSPYWVVEKIDEQ